MTTEPRIIKRYKNRRLYDPVTKEQITLAQVRELVKSGIEFRIKENHTGRDLTLMIMTQVLSDEIREWQNREDATEVLKALIKRGGDAGMTILSKTVLAAIGAISITKENAEKLIDELIKRGELDKSERAEAVKEAVDKAESRTREAVHKVRESVRTGTAKETLHKVLDGVAAKAKEVREQASRLRPASSDDVAALKRSIADLEAKLEELKAHSE